MGDLAKIEIGGLAMEVDSEPEVVEQEELQEEE